MKKIICLSLLVCIVPFLSCEKNDDNKPDDIKQIDLTKSAEKLVEADNAFGFELFQGIISEEEEGNNVFISPVSVALALAMTYNGADGETKTAMETTLKLTGLTIDEINQSYKDLINGLVSVDSKVELTLANSIWYRNTFYVEDEFIDVNKEYYDARVSDLDFTDPSAKDTINQWVEDKTNDRITDLISDINPEHVMFLINAIFFKGLWKFEFDKKDTHEYDFYLSDGTTKQVPYMYLKDTIPHFSNNLFQAVKLPYGKGKYNYVLLFPNEGYTTGDIVDELNAENWSDWMGAFHTSEFMIQIPKFKFKYEIELNEVLKSMGMEIAFTELADFTKINKAGNLFIDYVKHKSFVEVNEEGTEAAAATVVAVALSGIPEYLFANKPFLFAITEEDTGAIVFIGKVADPVYE